MRLIVKAKYTKRWRGPDGKWHYEYAQPGTSGGAKRGDPLADALGRIFASRGMSSVAGVEAAAMLRMLVSEHQKEIARHSDRALIAASQKRAKQLIAPHEKRVARMGIAKVLAELWKYEQSELGADPNSRKGFQGWKQRMLNSNLIGEAETRRRLASAYLHQASGWSARREYENKRFAQYKEVKSVEEMLPVFIAEVTNVPDMRNQEAVEAVRMIRNDPSLKRYYGL